MASAVYQLKAVIKADWDGKVRGAQQTLVVDSASQTLGEDGKYSYDAGKVTAKCIAAIKGTVKLDGGSSPAAIDLYIPVSSYVS